MKTHANVRISARDGKELRVNIKKPYIYRRSILVAPACNTRKEHYDDLIDGLTDRGYGVATFDRRGFGLTGGIPQEHLLGNDIDDISDALGMDPIVISHSSGAHGAFESRRMRAGIHICPYINEEMLHTPCRAALALAGNVSHLRSTINSLASKLTRAVHTDYLIEALEDLRSIDMSGIIDDRPGFYLFAGNDVLLGTHDPGTMAEYTRVMQRNFPRLEDRSDLAADLNHWLNPGWRTGQIFETRAGREPFYDAIDELVSRL